MKRDWKQLDLFMIKLAGTGKVDRKVYRRVEKEWTDYPRTLDFKNCSSEASLKHWSLSFGLKQATAIIILAQMNVSVVKYIF